MAAALARLQHVKSPKRTLTPINHPPISRPSLMQSSITEAAAAAAAEKPELPSPVLPSPSEAAMPQPEEGAAAVEQPPESDVEKLAEASSAELNAAVPDVGISPRQDTLSGSEELPEARGGKLAEAPAPKRRRLGWGQGLARHRPSEGSQVFCQLPAASTLAVNS